MTQIPNIIINYCLPNLIQFGVGAIANLSEHQQRLGAKKPLIVTDGGLLKTGIVARVTKSLDDAGIGYAIFDGVQPNPTDHNIYDGLAMYRDADCDMVIGLGGGSAMDAAKAIRVMTSHDGSLEDYYSDVGGAGKITSNMPKSILIATTAGTGSEVSRGAIITDTKQNRKRAVASPHLFPDVALLDPELTVSMPPKLTASTGMDALSHSVEAYVGKLYHPIAEGIALKAIKMVGENLRTVVEHGDDLNARGEMLLASTMGALAFQKGLGAVHSLAHQLSTEADISHGIANAIMMPPLMKFNLEYAQKGYADIATALGVDTSSMSIDETASAAIGAVSQLSQDVGIPQSLSELGLQRDSLHNMAQNAMLDHCYKSNPRPCTEKDMLKLYEEAF